MPILRYIALLLRHKYYVFRYGRKLGVDRRQLLVHDLSKLIPRELPFRADWKFGTQRFPEETAYAVVRHHHRNPHHWEHWVQVSGHCGYADYQALPMPPKYVREMCADWLAATHVNTGHCPVSLETWDWFSEHYGKMNLHPATLFCVEAVLEQFFSLERAT